MKTTIRIFVSLLVLASMLVSMPITALAMDDNPKDTVLDSVGKDDVMDVNNGTVTTNDGTITANHGNITTNNGSVEINGDGDGDGDGVGDSVNGVVSINNGEITTNNYYVVTNGTDGVIDENNCFVGDFYEYLLVSSGIEDSAELGDCTLKTGNFGTITDNNGTVVFNGEGGIVENNGVVTVDAEGNENCTPGVVLLNKGTVENNNSYMWFNFGTVGTNNEYLGFNYGTVETNKQSILDNNGTVETNDDGVLNNFGTIEENNAYVLWNTGTVEINNIKGIIGNGNTTDEDGNKVPGTIVTNYGTVIDNNIFYYGLELKSAGGEMETKLIQTVKDTSVNLTDLFAQDGYELVGYIKTYQIPEGDQSGLFEEDPIMVYSTEFIVEHPNLLNLIWRAVANPEDYKPVLSAGNTIWTNGHRFRIIAVEGDNYVLASCDTFTEEELEDPSAALGELLTIWQMRRLADEPQVLSPEMTAEFFGDNGFHITFTIPRTAL